MQNALAQKNVQAQRVLAQNQFAQRTALAQKSGISSMHSMLAAQTGADELPEAEILEMAETENMQLLAQVFASFTEQDKDDFLAELSKQVGWDEVERLAEIGSTQLLEVKAEDLV